MQDFHSRPHPSLVLKPSIIYIFLIHSGSLQKMLTALFNLVRNTQKSIWTIFFECQGKVFFSIEKILDFRRYFLLLVCWWIFLLKLSR